MAATVDAEPGGARRLGRARDALLGHEGVLAIILVAALILLATRTDVFLTTDNLLNQGRLVAEIGLVALPMTFIIITASVVGGVSILGGTGTVIGSTLAAVLLAAIGSALIFVNVSPYWIHAVQGLLILITVLADLTRRRRQAGRR